MSGGENNRSLTGWWNRSRRFLARGVRSGLITRHSADDGAVRTCRTLRPFLEVMGARPSPIIVDLGPVIGANVSFLGERLACKLFPEDLYHDLDRPFPREESETVSSVLAAKLLQEAGSVDGVLAWDVFDYLRPDEAALLATRLTTLLRPGGFVMALFTTQRRDEAASRRYVIVDAEHVRHRPAPGARWSRRVWPLRDIEVLLAPLEVVESHLLAHHQRELLLRQPPAR